jgi:hypothetical protein
MPGGRRRRVGPVRQAGVLLRSSGGEETLTVMRTETSSGAADLQSKHVSDEVYRTCRTGAPRPQNREHDMLLLPPQRIAKYSPAGHNPSECGRTCSWEGDPDDIEAWITHVLAAHGR